MATTADEVIIQQTNQYPFRAKDRQYTYPHYFANLRATYNLFSHIPWTGQSNDPYWTLNRRQNKEYLYPDYFAGGIFKSIKTIPWLINQLGITEYWTLNRRENREYLYQHVFNRTINHGLKTVPWAMTFSLYVANSYLNMKRTKEINKVYSIYPSFFMNIKTIPTYKWSCISVDTTDSWTCS